MYSCDIFKSYFYNYSFLNVVELHQDFFLNYVIKIIIKILPTIILTKGVVFLLESRCYGEDCQGIL